VVTVPGASSSLVHTFFVFITGRILNIAISVRFANNKKLWVHINISEVIEFLNDYYDLERNSERCSFLHTFVQKPERLTLV
jgi:hypothetical protein